MNPQTINPRVAAVNAEIARQGNKGFSVAPSAPTYVPPTEPIDASALGNVKPINIPEKPIPTSAAGLSGVSQGVVEQTRMAQKLEQDKMQAETAKESKQSSLEDTFKEYLGITQSVGQMEKEAGIDTKAQKATDVTNQIEALSRAKQNEIRALEQQPGTMAQKAQRQADIERQYAFQEADLALIQSAANRDLLTAQSIVDRRMQLALEPLKMQLDFDKFMYEDLKGDLTKAEEREFQNLMQEDEREYKKVEQLENTRSKLLMSASTQQAPSSVLSAISNAKTVEEAIQAAGQYAGDMLERQIKQAQLDKLNVELSALNEADIIATPMTPYEKEKQTRVLNAVDDLMGRTSLQTVGFASLGRMLPASLPRNFKTDLDTLKANIAFGELTAMRSASKTGGALGQVSERELALLEASLAGLDQGQSPSSFKKNLQQVKDSLARWYGAVDGLSEEQQLRAAGYTEEQILQIKNSQ